MKNKFERFRSIRTFGEFRSVFAGSEGINWGAVSRVSFTCYLFASWFTVDSIEFESNHGGICS